MATKKFKRTCTQGHIYYKSSDCVSCPICAYANRADSVFLTKLSAPARRALQQEKIDSVEKLATYTQQQILRLHGIGKSTIPILLQALQEVDLTFKSSN